MHASPLHLVFLVLGALLACSSGHVAKHDSHPLDTRAARPNGCLKSRAICAPGVVAPDGLSEEVDASMKLPDDAPYLGDIDRFMNTRTKDRNVLNLVTNVEGGDTMSSAKHDRLPDSGVLHRAVRLMCGCSSLIIFSESAVYFTHYWENLAFCANPGEPSADLDREVLGPLEDGREQVHASLKDHASDFKDQPGLQAFLMTPKAESGDGPLYPTEIEMIRDRVDNFIGIKPTIVLYEPLDGSDAELGTNARGAALFQYDANHDRQSDEPRLAKVWVERADEMTHQWGPSSTDSDDEITSPDKSPPPPEEVEPVDPPAAPSCYPIPTGPYQDSHESEVKSLTANFCDTYANKIERSPTVSIVETMRESLLSRLFNPNDREDDIYEMSIKSIPNCNPDGGFDLAQPVGSHKCVDILRDAWRNCNNNGRGGSIRAGCLTYSIRTFF